MRIRAEMAGDEERIYRVEQLAFGRDDEANLVNRLRKNSAVWLSQVVVDDNNLILGHALWSLVMVDNGRTKRQFPALGPIAVTPAYQNKGIGSMLIKSGLHAVYDAAYGLAFVLGHPDYYTRFGFKPAVPLGFTSPYVQENEPHEHFMVAVIDDLVLGKVSGHVTYREEFDGV